MCGGVPRLLASNLFIAQTASLLTALLTRRPDAPSLLERLTRYLLSKRRLLIVHRIDRDKSSPVVFARTRAAQKLPEVAVCQPKKLNPPGGGLPACVFQADLTTPSSLVSSAPGGQHRARPIRP